MKDMFALTYSTGQDPAVMQKFAVLVAIASVKLNSIAHH